MSNPLVEYKLLLEQFLAGFMSATEFQSAYLNRFKNEGRLEEQFFELLDELFGCVDSFTTDRQLKAENPGFYLDEKELRDQVKKALNGIEAMSQ